MRNKINILLFLLIIAFTLVACSSIEDSISEEEATQLVKERHDSINGEPEVISIELKKNAYIIEWLNEKNRESGTVRVKKNGDIEIIESQIE